MLTSTDHLHEQTKVIPVNNHLSLLCTQYFHNVSVGYHKAVNIIAELCTWGCNNLACEGVEVNIFRHLQAKRMFNFCLSIKKSKNKLMMSLKYYFSYRSFTRKNIDGIYANDYDVT